MKIVLEKAKRHYLLKETANSISLFDGNRLILDDLIPRDHNEYMEECQRGGNDSAILMCQIVTLFDSIYVIWRDMLNDENFVTYLGNYKPAEDKTA